MNKSDVVIIEGQNILIREGQPDDKNFVLSTVLRGLYYGETHFSHMNKSAFMHDYHGVVEKLLTTELLKVACFKDDPSTILGYALVSKDEYNIHFVFVKKPWRNIGIMKSLVSPETLFCTHLTKVGVSLIKKNPQLSYNPLLLER